MSGVRSARPSSARPAARCLVKGPGPLAVAGTSGLGGTPTPVNPGIATRHSAWGLTRKAQTVARPFGVLLHATVQPVRRGPRTRTHQASCCRTQDVPGTAYTGD